MTWWTDGAMVNAGEAGDEHFVGDAATPQDATDIAEAHNAILRGALRAVEKPLARTLGDQPVELRERIAAALHHERAERLHPNDPNPTHWPCPRQSYTESYRRLADAVLAFPAGSLVKVAAHLADALELHRRTSDGKVKECLPGCLGCAAIAEWEQYTGRANWTGEKLNERRALMPVGWAVFESDTYIDVVPVDADEEVVGNHIHGAACPCGPRLIQPAVSIFDLPVYSHREPGHPGANEVDRELLA